MRTSLFVRLPSAAYDRPRGVRRVGNERPRQGMEDRHWHTAKHALARMPVESGDTILDLGCGSGYAGRAPPTPKTPVGSTASTAHRRWPAMRPAIRTTRTSATSWVTSTRSLRRRLDRPRLEYGVVLLRGGPASDARGDRARSPTRWHRLLCGQLLRRERPLLRVAGVHHNRDDARWDREQYREAFRDAGLSVAEQDTIPDREITIPDESEFPLEDWDTREDMVVATASSGRC